MTASSENNTVPETIGSFESEAASIADIIDHMTGRSIFLFNEIFQTTVYEEAETALKELLLFIQARGGVSISVSHLKGNNETFIQMRSRDKKYVFTREEL